MSLIVKQINPTCRHTASLIFLHGSGDTGQNLWEWVRFLLGRDMTFEEVKVIYPTAPLQPYTPNDGQLSNVWFDRHSIDINAKENRQSLLDIYGAVQTILKQETSVGIPLNRIIVGGFSMGGALAMHVGYHLHNNLAGIFACSSFLNHDSIVYDSLKKRVNTETDLPELQMFHGGRDSLVPIQWGQDSFDKLKSLGVKGTFIPLKNTLHELKKQEMLDIEEWILHKLPNLSK
ncbi:lysophospholipase-like protein 1 [Stomoxys calcitrans]|uniref:lysophospholipase-like protein 1 n=1 Tax=Stomoxys calcitrans TaxID=35570 RepID=UPI0027E23F71|nr:lysophospholipase-like protein 1 [Stomoxys calcitrans]